MLWGDTLQRNLPRRLLKKFAWNIALALPITTYGLTPTGYVGDEIESTGSHSLGFGNAGSAAVVDQSSIRSNPAMLSLEKHYRVSAGYHFPTYGRDFYQLGIVDSRTSSVAAGFQYTAPRSTYKDPSLLEENDDKVNAYYDSQLKYRAVLGVSQTFGNLAFGIGGTYLETFDGMERQDGTGLNLGTAGLISPALRFSLSAENLANRGIRAHAPTTYRAGLAYTLFSGEVTAHADYRQRERTPTEGVLDLSPLDVTQPERKPPTTPKNPERMVTISASAQVQNLLRVLAAYGQNVDGIPRRSLSGGIAVVNKNFSLSYLASQPYLSNPRTHQAINLSMELTF